MAPWPGGARPGPVLWLKPRVRSPPCRTQGPLGRRSGWVSAQWAQWALSLTSVCCLPQQHLCHCCRTAVKQKEAGHPHVQGHREPGWPCSRILSSWPQVRSCPAPGSYRVPVPSRLTPGWGRRAGSGTSHPGRGEGDGEGVYAGCKPRLPLPAVPFQPPCPWAAGFVSRGNYLFV